MPAAVAVESCGRITVAGPVPFVFNPAAAPMNHAGNFTLPSARLGLAALLLLSIAFWSVPRFCWSRTSRTASALVLSAQSDQDQTCAFILRLPFTVMVQLLSGRRP